MRALETEDNHLHLHDPEEEEEEALSLCDLPLDENDGHNFQETTTTHTNTNTTRTTSNEPCAPELFEFLTNLSSEMCDAEDIIFRGKLIPSNYNEQNPAPSLHNHQQQQQQQLSSKGFKMSSIYEHKHGAIRRRSESLPKFQSSGSTKNKILRSSRSFDYQKLHRVSSSNTLPDSDTEPNSSVRSVGKWDNVNKIREVKPRRYLLLFGMVKFPPEMDLRDMKSRQFRRNSSMMFPSLDAAGNFPVNRKTIWRFLKALSCKDYASVAVTTPLCMPHA